MRGQVKSFIRQQPVFLGIAAFAAAIFWAVGQSTNIVVALVYSLMLGNMNTLAVVTLRPVLLGRRFPLDWISFLVAQIVLIPFGVFISTLVVFQMVGRPGGQFWPFLANSWKFPSLITLVFGIAYFIYYRAEYRLEMRDREYKQAVETSQAEREMQEQELQRAREIQQSLLPKRIPQIAGFFVAGVWEPARVVGGDYYDVIRLSDDRLAICLADVVGKGVSAALLMANVQATVRAYARVDATPDWVCSRVNEVLCSNIASDKFVTFFYGVLNTESRALEYCNAGHLQPIAVSSNGTSRSLAEGGAVLGVFSAWKYHTASHQFGSGDRLLLFTDGITEATRADGEEFGEERLVLASRAAHLQAPDEFNASLMSEVRTFCGNHLHDDATLLVVSVH
jgi:sigma-B regulation protein RsbU (phosphoserine phosphatase)